MSTIIVPTVSTQTQSVKNFASETTSQPMSALVPGFFDVIHIFLRVPPLFVIDEILRFDSRLSDVESLENTTRFFNNTITLDPGTYKFIVLGGIRLILSALGCLLAMCMFALNSKQLMVLFLHLISVATVFLSYWSNATIAKMILLNRQTDVLQNSFQMDPTVIIKHPMLLNELAINLSVQTFLIFLFIHAHLGVRHSIVKKLLPVSFFVPTILSILSAPPYILRYSLLASAFFPLVATRFASWDFIKNAFRSLHSSYTHAKTFASNYGFSALVEYQWTRLQLPTVFKFFWLLRTLEQVVRFYVSKSHDADGDQFSHYLLLKHLLTSSCDSPIAVLGFTSFISSISSSLGKSIQTFLQSENRSDFGSASAIVFYTLAIQNGLSGLDPEERFIGVCQNLCILFGTLLHFVHNIHNPILINLAASHNPSKKKHASNLGVSLALVLCSLGILYFLWTTQPLSAWLLTISIFCVGIFEKVFFVLIKYGLYVYDANRNSFWEHLDDYIFYAESLSSLIEVGFHVALFVIGVYIMIYESTGVVRMVVLCIQAYFNIWNYARIDWRNYLKRRAAMRKIERLQDATWLQLYDYDDVCAICYQPMENAKVTECNHLFHGICLRKWLNVKDRCPLCHEVPVS
ncbi:protein TRC8 homolog [Cylas formicarius]|uniref:protein TRC8 homolog n=1 Tax=Cylas formicarius TaxID=197179 RepID=UPI002958DE93|nr:protein TRC8 homolog [Cylas formicarius]